MACPGQRKGGDHLTKNAVEFSIVTEGLGVTGETASWRKVIVQHMHVLLEEGEEKEKEEEEEENDEEEEEEEEEEINPSLYIYT